MIVMQGRNLTRWTNTSSTPCLNIQIQMRIQLKIKTWSLHYNIGTCCTFCLWTPPLFPCFTDNIKDNIKDHGDDDGLDDVNYVDLDEADGDGDDFWPILNPVVGADAAPLDAVTLHKLFVLLVVTLVFCDFVNDCWSILSSFFFTLILKVHLHRTDRALVDIQVRRQHSRVGRCSRSFPKCLCTVGVDQISSPYSFHK